MVFQPLRFTPPAVTCMDRELLPRVFTLSPETRGGNFLWHFLSSRHLYPGSLPVRKYGALRCPDFPPCTSMAIEQTAVVAKVKIYANNS